MSSTILTQLEASCTFTASKNFGGDLFFSVGGLLFVIATMFATGSWITLPKKELSAPAGVDAVVDSCTSAVLTDVAARVGINGGAGGSVAGGTGVEDVPLVGTFIGGAAGSVGSEDAPVVVGTFAFIHASILVSNTLSIILSMSVNETCGCWTTGGGCC